VEAYSTCCPSTVISARRDRIITVAVRCACRLRVDGHVVYAPEPVGAAAQEATARPVKKWIPRVGAGLPPRRRLRLLRALLLRGLRLRRGGDSPAMLREPVAEQIQLRSGKPKRLQRRIGVNPAVQRFIAGPIPFAPLVLREAVVIPDELLLRGQPVEVLEVPPQREVTIAWARRL